jgi:hypothetical protein
VSIPIDEAFVHDVKQVFDVPTPTTGHLSSSFKRKKENPQLLFTSKNFRNFLPILSLSVFLPFTFMSHFFLSSLSLSFYFFLS